VASRRALFAESSRKWWTLGAVAFSLFMTMLDGQALNVALASVQRDLHAGFSQLQWVVNAYALTWAVLMLTGGTLADHLGRRRIFLSGLAAFVAASLLSGLSTSVGTLIAGRALQGTGAALMTPPTLSIISTTFAPRERGLAFGIWAGIAACALASGPLVGGLLTESLG
jgi:MFS family permease